MRRCLTVWLVVVLAVSGCSRASAPKATSVSTPTATEQNSAASAANQPGEKHRQALALIGEGKSREAEPILRSVVAEEPGNADAWNDLSFVQASLMRYSDAIESARTALRLRPDFVYAQYNLGSALLNTADWRKAKEPLEASRRAQPDRPEPIYALGRFHELSNDSAGALDLYRTAAAMGYAPAQRSVTSLTNQEQRRAASDEAVARFPQAPQGVIRGVMEGYIPEGTTRKLQQVIPVRFDAKQPPLWAALALDQYRDFVSAKVEVFTAQAKGTFLDGYMGTCVLSSRNAEVQPKLQTYPFANGEHLIMEIPGEAIICGFKGDRVTELHRTKAPVTVAGGRLDIGGQSMRFVPETSRYLPAAAADTLLTLVGEVRAAGATLATTEAVAGEVSVAGQPAQVLVWSEASAADRIYRMRIAVKPIGGSPILYSAGNEVIYHYPAAVGQVTVPGHVFLAVATHQPGAPNGGDVLVLEYDKAKSGYRQVFHGQSDGAAFGKDSVSTTFKKYRPEGGFDLYTTTYTWDEAKGTFVAGKAELVPLK